MEWKPGWFLFRARVNGPPPPPISFRRPYTRSRENGMDLTWNNWLAVNEIPRSLMWIIILCLLAFFATCSTTTLLLFILINGAVQPQRNVEFVGCTVLMKYLHFVKSKLEGMAHTIHLLAAQTTATNDLFQKSNSLWTTSEAQPENCQAAVWNSSWW